MSFTRSGRSRRGISGKVTTTVCKITGRRTTMMMTTRMTMMTMTMERMMTMRMTMMKTATISMMEVATLAN